MLVADFTEWVSFATRGLGRRGAPLGLGRHASRLESHALPPKKSVSVAALRSGPGQRLKKRDRGCSSELVGGKLEGGVCVCVGGDNGTGKSRNDSQS